MAQQERRLAALEEEHSAMMRQAMLDAHRMHAALEEQVTALIVEQQARQEQHARELVELRGRLRANARAAAAGGGADRTLDGCWTRCTSDSVCSYSYSCGKPRRIATMLAWLLC